MLHCCSVGSPLHIKSDMDIKSPSQADFFFFSSKEKKWKNCPESPTINIQTVILPVRGGMISLTTNTELPSDLSSQDKGL